MGYESLEPRLLMMNILAIRIPGPGVLVRIPEPGILVRILGSQILAKIPWGPQVLVRIL